MTINGIELAFKITNATVADRYERALNQMQASCERAEKNPPEGLAAIIRAQTAMVRDFVDTVFGEGTYARLGVDPDDLDENLGVVAQVNAEAERQKGALQSRLGKYDPRRAKRHKS